MSTKPVSGGHGDDSGRDEPSARPGEAPEATEPVHPYLSDQTGVPTALRAAEAVPRELPNIRSGGTTPEEVYRACAESSWEQPGTQRLWRPEQRETYIGLMLARSDWRALVDAAFRAGQAAILRQVADECDTIRQADEPGEFMPSAETWMRHRADQIEAGSRQVRRRERP